MTVRSRPGSGWRMATIMAATLAWSPAQAAMVEDIAFVEPSARVATLLTDARHAEAAALLEAELATCRAASTVRVACAPLMRALSETRHTTREFQAAETLAREAVTLAEAQFGADHPIVGLFLGPLAVALAAQGAFGEAENVLRRQLASLSRVAPRTHPDLIRIYINLASVLLEQEKVAEAEKYQSYAVEALNANGFESAEYRLAQMNLAVILEATGKLELAEAMIREAIAGLKGRVPECSPGWATAHNNLGSILQTRRNYAAAARAYQTALRIRARCGATARSYGTLNNLASLYQRLNRTTAARTTYREAARLALADQERDPQQVLVLIAAADYALMHAGDAAQARTLYRSAERRVFDLLTLRAESSVEAAGVLRRSRSAFLGEVDAAWRLSRAPAN